VAGHGHSVDEYLEVIYFLAFPIGEYRPAGESAIASRVAEMLGVSRASAGEMLKRLEADGLVERGEQKEAILTPAGIERAERVVRKHRIIERFLTDFMGYTASESHVQADELGDTFTDEMIERMYERLGRPDRCPHGWPVSPEVEQTENVGLLALAELQPGQAGEIVRLAEHDGDLLHWFYDQGFEPGRELRLTAADPAAGSFRVQLNGREETVAEKAAAGLFVRPS
jgi:DtxR family Mn-dependent transcriptional regulator